MNDSVLCEFQNLQRKSFNPFLENVDVNQIPMWTVPIRHLDVVLMGSTLQQAHLIKIVQHMRLVEIPDLDAAKMAPL